MRARRLFAGAPALLLCAWLGAPALGQLDGGEFNKDWFYGSEDQRKAHAALAGKEAPELHLSDWKNVDTEFESKLSDGFQWEDFEGKVVLIDYWATW